MEIEDWGLIAYREAWSRQTTCFNDNLRWKQEGHLTTDRLIFCEHPPVVTLGRRADRKNVLLDKEALLQRGFDLCEIDRGGDVTYHGPGQWVVYPIFDLEHYAIGLKEYIFRLEEAIIRLLMQYRIKAERLAGATGVWLDTARVGTTRKICAIGVRSSRYITMHGLALNVNTDLTHFSVIHPCGFIDKGVTSMQQELQRKLDMQEVKNCLIEEFKELYR